MTALSTTQLQVLESATDGDLSDGIELLDGVETQDTIESFISASANYNERTIHQIGTFAGFPCLCFRLVQVRKGDQRKALSVIDLGNVRVAVIGTDLRNYDAWAA